MCTVLVTYDPRNQVANGLMNTLSHVKGVKIDEEALLTEEEMIAIENVRKYGVCTDIENLKAYLKSQL